MWVVRDNDIVSQIDGWDRAAQFGDGLFETMQVKQGKIVGLERHVSRMQHGLGVLGIAIPQSLTDLFGELLGALLSASKLENGNFKCVISRGNSSRGYRSLESIKPNIMGFFSVPTEYPPEYYQQGIHLCFCRTESSVNQQLAGLKHLNRLDSVLAARELNEDTQEGLLLNAFGEVVEGTMSNIFLEVAGKLHTPDLTRSGVLGTMRQAVIDYCLKNKIEVCIASISKQDVMRSESIFLTNRLIGAWPVQALEGESFKVGPITRQIVKAYQLGELDA